MHDLRRNDYDVTNSVQVSSTAAVTAAVRELFASAYPGESFDRVAVSFEEFDKLFTGRMPGYHGVDTGTQLSMPMLGRKRARNRALRVT